MNRGSSGLAIFRTGVCLAGLAAILVACGPRPTPSPVAALSPDSLANAEYLGAAPVEGAVRLQNGEFHEAAAPGSAGEVSIRLVPGVQAFGDLNGDNIPDASVILAGSGGGSGTFISLAAVVNDGGKPRNAGTAFLGDRVQVQSNTIDSGRITVKMLSHAPTDPLCCPTLETTRIFQLQGDSLVEVSAPG